MTSTTEQPDLECDVVMKGGITSGVVYPLALQRVGRTYRIRSIGGTSAGAIAAAIGAAAEHGRADGGMDKLGGIPAQLADGRLEKLFQPQPTTRSLMRLLLTATANGQSALRKVSAVLGVAVSSHALAAVLGAVPGLLLVAAGIAGRGTAAAVLVGTGLVAGVLGSVTSVGWRVWRTTTTDLPENLFGICRGLGTPDSPGFTDWLSDCIDDVAGIPGEGPLLFGHLWRGGPGTPDADLGTRRVDLQMVTTCLSQGRPYRLPFDARTFFYDPAEWATLFPANVMAALNAGPTSTDGEDAWEEAVAEAHDPALRRLPEPAHLPVIVATRMSLSFPVLISAVPMYTIDRRSPGTRRTVEQYREADRIQQPPPTSGLEFTRIWFSDGGLCSNFPLHMFDAALPTRPTFAINLGSFPRGVAPDPDQRNNIEYAEDNRALLPTNAELPSTGLAAIVGFATAAAGTARNWSDGSLLDFPGYRDRIVRVLQTPTEGGLNLRMTGETIAGLSERGEAAADAIVNQFTQPRYPAGQPVATGWDNHRWVRYRALMAALPDWLASFAAGRAVLNIDPAQPPSYGLGSQAQRDLVEELAGTISQGAEAVARSSDNTIEQVTGAPRPLGNLRRVPRH